MEIHFLGVGEAFDPARGNTASVLRNRTSILIDCGYAIPALFFQSYPDPDEIDAIYITHFHADHTFGLPAMLSRFHFDGRKKPLGILGQVGTERFITNLLEVGYPGLAAGFAYPIYYRESNEHLSFEEFSLDFALTDHPLTNYAVRFTVDGKFVGFSGDGDLTPASLALFQNCDVVVHEAYAVERPCPGHVTVQKLLAAAAQWTSMETLAIVHLGRHEDRDEIRRFIGSAKSPKQHVLVPEPGQRLVVTRHPPLPATI